MNQKRPVKYLIMRALRRTPLSILFFINRGKYRLRFYPSSISGVLWVDPFSYDCGENFFRSYLHPRDVVIDIGANIGVMTLEASVIVGDSGKVFAIEPHPKTFKYLRGNIKLNRVKNVLAYNVALGDIDGTALFSDGRQDDQNSIMANGDGVKIPIRQLDNLPIDERVIALLKIDVEGYEKFVLQGAKNTLQRTECVFFESCDQHFSKYGYTCGDLFEFLKSYGFQIFKIFPDSIISPVPLGYVSTENENLLAVRSLERFLQRTAFQLKR